MTDLRHLYRGSACIFRRTYRWTRIRPYRPRFREQGVFFAFQSRAGCITNICGFDLRQAQARVMLPGSTVWVSLVEWHYIAPGKPMQRASAAGWLNEGLFTSYRHARASLRPTRPRHAPRIHSSQVQPDHANCWHGRFLQV